MNNASAMRRPPPSCSVKLAEMGGSVERATNALMTDTSVHKKKKAKPAATTDKPKAYKTILPAARVDAFLRSNLKTKRVSAGSSVFVTSAVEEVLKSIVEIMAANATPRKKNGFKRLGRLDLIRAIRNDSCLSKLFRSYVFAPRGAQLKFDALRLLNKGDRAALVKKREAQKKAREAAQKAKASASASVCAARVEIPEVDEE